MFKKLALTILLTSCEVIQSCQDVNKPGCDDFVDLGKAHQMKNIQEIEEEEFILIPKEERLMLKQNETCSLSEDGSGNGLEEENEKMTTSSNNQISDNNCIESGYTDLCSGKGQCIDNKCICDFYEFVDENDNTTLSYRFSGEFCEECPYCNGQRCRKFLPCLECNLFDKNQNCDSVCDFNYTASEKITRNVDNDEKMCEIENSNGCFIRFKYFYNDHNVVKVEYEKDILCLNGFKFIVFTFWGVVIYIFALTLLTPRLCSYSRRCTFVKSRSMMSLPRGHDIIRLDLLR